MSWWTDLTSGVSDAFSQDDTFLGGIGDFARSNLGGTLINLGAKELGLLEPNIPVVGYQGGIPEYQAVRERVPMPADPNRRPGSGGRRYFSDVVYADRPERQPMSVAQAQQQARTQAQGLAALNQPPKMSGGGRYLDGATDGMADVVPARISGGQEARLSDGEFVRPADVVSHLGNGNTDAGAKQLHAMMTRVRKERTGNPKQGKQIKAQKMLPT